MAIKKVLVQKKIEGVIYDIYQKTSADVVVYDDASTVAQKIAELVTGLDNVTKQDGTIDSKIKAESEALYNKIMGFTEGDKTINEAYDTLKEVAKYLEDHGSVVQGFTTDIAGLKTTIGTATSGETPATGLIARIETLESDVSALKTTVGDSSSGLVKDVADNKAAIASLKAAAVTDSDQNGYIKVGEQEIQVYDDSAIAATKIVEDETHRFTTDTEKTAWNANAEIIVASEAPNDLAETDLLMLVIG